MQTDGKLISVVIPVFNEEPTVGNVIRRLKTVLQQTGLSYEIIVVDDCSRDKSREVAKSQGVAVFALKQHMGKGYALRAGFAAAKGGIVATIDSDGSHRPEELTQLLDPVLRGEADLVIGSRFSNGKAVYARRLNAVGNRLFNRLIHALLGHPITDSQSGYRVMTRNVLRTMRLRSGEYEIESEMLVKTARRGFRIKEVPISFEQRTYGTSHVDPMRDGLKILFSILSAYMRS
ncbi:MAG: glycosyltransferase family 2 protein [Candidatus Bathyarchaeia archaeon]